MGSTSVRCTVSVGPSPLPASAAADAMTSALGGSPARSATSSANPNRLIPPGYVCTFMNPPCRGVRMRRQMHRMKAMKYSCSSRRVARRFSMCPRNPMNLSLVRRSSCGLRFRHWDASSFSLALWVSRRCDSTPKLVRYVRRSMRNASTCSSSRCTAETTSRVLRTLVATTSGSGPVRLERPSCTLRMREGVSRRMELQSWVSSKMRRASRRA
mmetsp:Transcript_13419/g.40585  ORF Transcript_13419/g.40585 Transcript_13419/m.40585 type:complete len:213 (+) Transcript_13419:1718-2356(+)